MAAAVVLLAATLPVRGATAQESEDSAGEEPVVLFIIDLSGSMNQDFGDGRSRLEVAKAAFVEAFERVPENAAIGVRVYGDRMESKAPAARQENCEKDTRLAVPIDTGNRDEILREVGSFEATGDTPIGLALETAAEEDIPEGSLATVVLFSDGLDECWDADLDGDPKVGPSWGPDPCDVAKKVAGKGVDLRIDKINTIGFKADEAEEQLRCIAESTGGTFVPVETEEDARQAIPDMVIGSMRPAVHLCEDNVIEGTPTAEGAPDLERIAPGETSRCYTDTMAIGEERWYRIEDYGPGSGHTTFTAFGVPPIEGTTQELRMEPGPEGEIGSAFPVSAENILFTDAQDSIRCGGCHVVGSSESHTLYWVVTLRSDNPRAKGTVAELELLLEGEAWGGRASGCLEGMTCWYEAEIDGAEARLDELQAQLEGDEDTQALQSEVDELEAELASLTAKKQALEDGGSGGTNWLLPLLLLLVALGAGGVWFLQTRRNGPQPAAAGTIGSTGSGVIGTIDLGSPGTGTAPTSGAGSAGLSGKPLGEPTDLSAPIGGEEVTEVPATGPQPGSGPEVPDAGREVPRDQGLEVPPVPEPEGPEPDPPERSGGAQPAGWYADPDAPDLLRWWDGNAWTDHTQRKG